MRNSFRWTIVDAVPGSTYFFLNAGFAATFSASFTVQGEK